jgi:Mn-dependent DtxR family transcriptional regulator
MLKDLLNMIERDGYLSRKKLASALGVTEAVVDDGIAQLVRMGLLKEEETGSGCATTCASCPFAKTCGKEIVKTYQINK